MNSNSFGTIIQIGDILVSEDVVCEYFACDYSVCRGQCCIDGDAGAPLEEEELDSLERDYPAFSPLMSEDGIRRVEELGFFEVDRDGDLVTPCLPITKECAYCKLTPDNCALCTIEMAGRTKPVSCSLYPIRVSKMPGGGLALNLHRWKICAPAYAKGKRENIRVFEFLKAPLIKRFGADFYEALCAAAEQLKTQTR